MDKVNIIEAIITWQAEGVNTGERVLILRFKNCSRKCVWCDTALKMRNSIEMQLSFKEIQRIVSEEKCGIILTGGEPTFNDNLESSIKVINEIDCKLFNVETNGHDLIGLIEKVNPDKNVHYSLSPKLFTSEDYRLYLDIVEKIKDNPRVFIKLVYEDRPIIENFLIHLRDINFDNRRVFLMPEGATKDEIIRHSGMVFDAAEKYKFNFSSREHIIYGFI